jgi:hypothetical protein
MSRTLRWAQWTVVATAVLLLFWVAASLGGWSPNLRRLTTNVHGPLVADYRAESPQQLAPLSTDITADASRDQASLPSPRPGATPSAGPSPSGSGPVPTPTLPAPTPTLPVPTPTLPVPTPTLPVPTPTLPVPTPTLPIATPTLPPTPSLPTLPPLP